jgi:hypothetical protein
MNNGYSPIQWREECLNKSRNAIALVAYEHSYMAVAESIFFIEREWEEEMNEGMNERKERKKMLDESERHTRRNFESFITSA